MNEEKLRERITLFNKMINTADEELAKELIVSDAEFFTPASPDQPLKGGKGYLQVVYLMRSGFPDVQWILKDIAFGENKVAVNWTLKVLTQKHLWEWNLQTSI